MSRPETQMRRPRDSRIDFFRGLLLWMIFVDHVPGNPYEHWATIRNWGFSDAAESFFIISGIAAGIAYSGRFATWRDTGLWPAIAPMWKRSWVLYLSHIFLTVAGIAIFALGAEALGLVELLTKNNLKQVFQNTAQAIIGIVTLGHQIGYMNILPAYSVLLLAAPFAILIGQRAPRLLLIGSVLLWFGTGLWRWNLPAYPNAGGWFFNPFAWQLIFVVGLLTGIAFRRGERFVPVNRALFWVAAGWLALVLAWRYVPEFGPAMNRGMAWLAGQGFPFHITSHDKTYLPFLRMTHALALVYVVSCLPVVTTLTAQRWGEPLRVMGRQGLLIFSAGALLSYVGQTLIAWQPDNALIPWLYIPAGTVALVLLAWAADWKRRAGTAGTRALTVKDSRADPLAAE